MTLPNFERDDDGWLVTPEIDTWLDGERKLEAGTEYRLTNAEMDYVFARHALYLLQPPDPNGPKTYEPNRWHHVTEDVALFLNALDAMAKLRPKEDGTPFWE